MSKLLDRVSQGIDDLQQIKSVLTLLETGDVAFTDQLIEDMTPIGKRDHYFRDILIQMELTYGVKGCGLKAARRWGLTHSRISQFNRELKAVQETQTVEHVTEKESPNE